MIISSNLIQIYLIFKYNNYDLIQIEIFCEIALYSSVLSLYMAKICFFKFLLYIFRILLNKNRFRLKLMMVNAMGILTRGGGWDREI